METAVTLIDIAHPFKPRARYMMPSGQEARFCHAGLDDGEPVAAFEYVLAPRNGKRPALGETVTLAQRAWHLPVKMVAVA